MVGYPVCHAKTWHTPLINLPWTFGYWLHLTLTALSATEPAFVTVLTNCVFMHVCGACGMYVIHVVVLSLLSVWILRLGSNADIVLDTITSPFHLSSDGIHECSMFLHPHFMKVAFEAASIVSSNKGVTTTLSGPHFQLIEPSHEVLNWCSCIGSYRYARKARIKQPLCTEWSPWIMCYPPSFTEHCITENPPLNILDVLPCCRGTAGGGFISGGMVTIGGSSPNTRWMTPGGLKAIIAPGSPSW